MTVTHLARAAPILLLAYLTVGAAGCSSSSDVPKFCSSDRDCGSGEVCGSRDCHFAAECLPAGCACVQNEFGYAVPGDACLIHSNCTCDNATCANPRDSCGMAVCAGVCPEGESCAVCLDGKTCGNVEICSGSFCIANDARTKATCRPLECAFRPVPPLCGTPDALCGEECCQPDCTGRECGDDPRCGVSCGTCGPETFCDFEHGQCQLVTGVSACAGDLRATPPKITVEQGESPKPQAAGGKIIDGIYDLVATREYVRDAFSTVYERAALRFFDDATQAEQIFDRDRNYFLADDEDSPHRLLTVVADGSVLHFTVSCPDTVISIYRAYDRGFTVRGSELWLFQPELIEIYRARQ